MSPVSPVVTTLRDFVARIASLDTPVEREPTIELRVICGDTDETLTLSPSVVQALKHALEDYHDPRDSGDCDHCGSRRVDRNFICQDCGEASGVFGQLLKEHSSRYRDPFGLPGPDQG
ncbi:hypothetical protein [Allorhizocola rhizosphaerae]|uniref:hypothetical protein n=1 Tax=Allorhizocola rhizosphaerae TaxID=1872709 RepID=UPI0013C37583|nr:hypothetical protein [Allorhizocola rhizosphaerae]